MSVWTAAPSRLKLVVWLLLLLCAAAGTQGGGYDTSLSRGGGGGGGEEGVGGAEEFRLSGFVDAASGEWQLQRRCINVPFGLTYRVGPGWAGTG